MLRRRTVRSFGSFLIAVGLAIGIVALVVELWPWGRQMLAGIWQTRFESLPEDSLVLGLREAAASGPPGMLALAAAIGSERANVAKAAHEVLCEELDRLAGLPSRDSTPRLALMAQSLALSVEDYDPATRRRVAGVAERLLLLRIDADVIDGSRFADDCQKILLASQAEHRDPEPEPPAQQPRSTKPSRIAAAPRYVDPLGGIRELEILAGADLAGGGLPVEHATTPLLFELADDSGSPAANASAELLAKTLRQTHLPPGDTPRLFPEPPQLEPLLPAGAGPIGDADEPAVVLASGTQDLVDLATIDVMRLLAAEEERTAALAELTRRGFDERELELARRLTGDNPQMRLDLVEALPRMSGVDAWRWLWWLSDDPSGEVRLAALTVLATSDDPSTLRRIEDIGRHDPDPRVVKLAERLLSRDREN